MLLKRTRVLFEDDARETTKIYQAPSIIPFQDLPVDEQLSCDGCGESHKCCNYVDVVGDSSETRYCCGAHLPRELQLRDNAVILRLHLGEGTSTLRGVHVDWKEVSDEDSGNKKWRENQLEL